jgi:hypothetical protein
MAVDREGIGIILLFSMTTFMSVIESRVSPNATIHGAVVSILYSD